MAEKISHSKYRNTGLIFELLTRQIVADVLSENKDSAAVDLLHEYFQEDRELGKELMLYQALIEGDFADEDRAQSLIDNVLEQRRKLDDGKLQEQKHELVGEIKERYPLKEFFQTKVDEYKELASVYKLFKSLDESETHDPEDLVRCRYTLSEHIQNDPSDTADAADQQSERIQKLKEKSREVRVWAQKLMIERFNDKYGSQLDNDQKEVLREYIENVSNTNDFRQRVNERVDNIESDLEGYLDEIDSEVAQIKVEEALNQIGDLKKGHRVDEDQVMNLLMFQELRNRIQERIDSNE